MEYLNTFSKPATVFK